MFIDMTSYLPTKLINYDVEFNTNKFFLQKKCPTQEIIIKNFKLK